MYARSTLSLVLYLAFSAPLFAADTSKATATVNGKVIPQTHVDFVAKARAAEGQPDTPELRARVREYLINREVLAQEAAKQGVDRTPDVTMQIELARKSLLVANLLERYKTKHPISEEALKNEYERQRALLGDKEYLPAHILVEDQAEAQKIIAQLKEGAEFQSLAKEKTKDEVTKMRGGALQWSVPAGLVPQFAEAIVKLKKGEYTQEPVKTEHGWHIIKLEDERAVNPPTFDQVRVQLAEAMQREQVDKYVQGLRAKANIKTID